MQKLLMFMYHLTPDQAAARVPLFQFWLTAFGANILFYKIKINTIYCSIYS